MKKLWDKFIDYFVNDDPRGLIKFCAIATPFILIFAAVVIAMLRFAVANKAVALCVAMLILAIVCAFAEKKEKKEGNAAIKAAPSSSGAKAQSNMVSINRMLLRALSEIFKENARRFGIVPPKQYSDLKDDLPAGYSHAKKCCVYYYKVIADGEPINKALFCEHLSSAFQDRLDRGKLDLGRPMVEFNNGLYPKVFVDSADYMSGAWHIALIVCDTQAAAAYIDSQASYASLDNSLPQSEEVWDNDFV